MDSTPSKIFTVSVFNCENPSHANKIAKLLRTSFPHRAEHVTDKPRIHLTVIVKAESIDSIRSVISPALGKAHAVLGSEPVWLDSRKLSSEPPPYIRFEPPTPL